MSEYVKKKPKTVCRECEHMIPTATRYCRAKGFPGGEEWSVLTGERRTITLRCEDMNTGDCPQFERKT